jgi:hypothetical protein
MKKLLVCLLIISLGINIFYLRKKFHEIHKWNEIKKLLVYKKISYEKGTDCFFQDLKKNYPEIQISNKNILVYRWDSLYYNIIHEDQLKALDSLANHYGNHQMEFILVTEMEETASREFLARNGENFKNVKMLFGMDDFISGLHNIKGLKLLRPIIKTQNLKGKPDSTLYFAKQVSFYAIIDSQRKVLYTNENRGSVLKDTIFLNKIKHLTTENYHNILN